MEKHAMGNTTFFDGSVTITLDLLKSKGACQTALTDLETTHGRTVTFRDPPTLARALQASGRVSWFAANMLTSIIRAEYIRQHAPISAKYKRQHAPLWAEYDRQCDPIWAEYDRQCATIRAEYDRQCATIVATLYFEKVSGMNRRPS